MSVAPTSPARASHPANAAVPIFTTDRGSISSPARLVHCFTVESNFCKGRSMNTISKVVVGVNVI